MKIQNSMHFIEPATMLSEINHNSPTTPSSQYSSGKTWADIAAGGSRTTSPTGLPRQSVSGILLYSILKNLLKKRSEHSS
jgi:hypothetical protein